jgi:hypothetical protein
MHVWPRFCQKVHYNALFGYGKREKKAFSAEFAATQRKETHKSQGKSRFLETRDDTASHRVANFNKFGQDGDFDYQDPSSTKSFISTHMNQKSP